MFEENERCAVKRGNVDIAKEVGRDCLTSEDLQKN
jgi:hypothetical protein